MGNLGPLVPEGQSRDTLVILVQGEHEQEFLLICLMSVCRAGKIHLGLVGREETLDHSLKNDRRLRFGHNLQE